MKSILFLLLFVINIIQSELQKVPNFTEQQQLDQLLIPSLFPHVPPYIKFASSAIKYNYPTPLPGEVRNETELPYGFTLPEELKPFLRIDTLRTNTKARTFLYQFILNHTGLIKLGPDFEVSPLSPAKRVSTFPAFATWGDQECTSARSRARRAKKTGSGATLIRNYQKYDHTPGVSLGNKARHCLTHRNQIVHKFGIDGNDFVLPCFSMPDERKKFERFWERTIGRNKEQLWLSKPSRASVSRGIKLFTNFSEFLKILQDRSSTKRGTSHGSFIVQQYLPTSYLYNGKKPEVRVYVLVTSADPLRIYLSYDSFVLLSAGNFSSNVTTAEDACRHIAYHASCTLNEANETRIKETNIFFKENFTPQQVQSIKSQIESATIKSILSIRKYMKSACKRVLYNRYNSFHLLTFDFFLSDQLHVWLNEINTGPILRQFYRSQMLAEAWTIAGYHLPPTVSKSGRTLVWNHLVNHRGGEIEKDEVVFNKKLYEFWKEGVPHRNISQPYLETMLEDLTPDDVRQLIIAEDELNRVSTRFIRIFPTIRMATDYMKFLDLESEDSYYYKLFAAWEYMYGKNIGSKHREAAILRLRNLTEKKFHLLP